VHLESKGRYGSPRIHRALRAEGVRVSEKRVARLMRACGIVGAAVKKYGRRNPGASEHLNRFSNLLVDLKPTKPLQALATDITYLKVGQRTRYLALVKDIHTKKVLGLALSWTKDSELTKEALRCALEGASAYSGAILHSDRGSEYMSAEYADLAKSNGLLQSANRPQKVTDNSWMESLWHSLKSEMYYWQVFKSAEELDAAVKQYFIWYNNERLHSSIDYRTPAEYEKNCAAEVK
jgi:putative transposase